MSGEQPTLALSLEQLQILKENSKDEAAFDRLRALVDDLQSRLSERAAHIRARFDHKLHCMEGNGAFAEFAECDQDDLRGTSLAAMNLPSDVREALVQGFAVAFQQHRQTMLHIELPNNELWGMRVVPEFDGDAIPTALLVGHRGDYRFVERALRREHQRYEALFNQSNDGVFLLTPQGQHLQVNERAAELLGYTVDELLQLTYPAIVAPDEQSQTERVMQRLMQGERFPIYERTFVHRNGAPLPVEVNVDVIRDENEQPRYILSIIRDIRERKALEQALHSREQQYRLLVENVKDVIFQTDLEGRWLFLNRAWEEMTGYPRTESLGLPFLHFVHPDDRTANEAEFQALLNNPEQDYFWHHMRYLRRDETYCDVEAYVRLIRDENEQPIGSTGILRDISERLLTEQTRAENQRLEFEFQQQRQLHELKTRMMERVDHEFRTPLSVITTTAHILRKYFDRLEDEHRNKYFDQVYFQVRKMEQLLEGINFVVRGREHRLNFAPHHFDLVSVCRSTCQTMAADQYENYKIHFDSSSPEVIIHADSDLLRSVLVNLLSNAMKYSLTGGEIWVAVRRDGQAVELSVKDRGIGIPEEDGDHVFEALYRGNNFGERPGLGLGLTQVKAAVDLHQGEVSFVSNPEGGTTFVVRIPQPE